MKLTEHQLRNAIQNILTELLGGKKKTSYLEDMLGQGYGSGGMGGGGYGYGGDSLYGDYDFYLEDTYGVEMGGDDYGDDGDDGGDGDGGE